MTNEELAPVTEAELEHWDSMEYHSTYSPIVSAIIAALREARVEADLYCNQMMFARAKLAAIRAVVNEQKNSQPDWWRDGSRSEGVNNASK